MTYDRKDRLWPAHFMSFATNPMNIAYGATGIALFLQKGCNNGLSKKIVDWMIDQPLSTEHYPPGLFFGLSGIAQALLLLGQQAAAESTINSMLKSEMLFMENGIAFGIAGCGVVSLQFYRRYRKDKYLNQAIRAGDHLIKEAVMKGDLCYWKCNHDTKIHFGFGFGSSGIALFLLYLFLETNNHKYLDHAVKRLEYDLLNKVETKVRWQWKRFEGDSIVYPYIVYGSAGIGSILIRFYYYTGDKRYKKLACQIAEDAFIKYAFIPSLFGSGLV